MPNACVHNHQSTSRGAYLGTVQFFILACDECGQDDVSRIISWYTPTEFDTPRPFTNTRVEYNPTSEWVA